jgi:hypothetical protein
MRMREFTDRIDGEEQELLRQAEWHKTLWQRPEFRAFRDLAEKHAQAYIESLLQSASARTEQSSDEYLKGAIYGLRLTFKLSERIMQAAAELRERGITEENEEDGQ